MSASPTWPSVCIDPRWESLRLISLIITSAHELDHLGLGESAIRQTDQILIYARPNFRSPPVPGTQLGRKGSHHTGGNELNLGFSRVSSMSATSGKGGKLTTSKPFERGLARTGRWMGRSHRSAINSEIEVTNTVRCTR